MHHFSRLLIFTCTLFAMLNLASADPQNTSDIPSHSSPFDTDIPTPTNEPAPTDSNFSIQTDTILSTTPTDLSSASASASGAVSSASMSMSSVQSSVSSAIASETSEIGNSLSSLTATASSTSSETGNVAVMQKPLATVGAVLGGALLGVAALL